MSSGPCEARRYRVLLVEAEPAVLEATRRLLARGFDVRGFPTGGLAMVALARERFDVVLVDVDLRDVPVDSFLRDVRELAPRAARVALTADPFAAHELVERELVSRVVDKPSSRTALIECLVSAVETHDSRADARGETARLYAFRTSR